MGGTMLYIYIYTHVYLTVRSHIRCQQLMKPEAQLKSPNCGKNPRLS